MRARGQLRFPDPPRKNDALFLHDAQGILPSVRTYVQDRVEVVHGPACRPESEVHVEACRKDGIAVVPRRGGGGTVVLSPGVVVIVVVGRCGKDQSVHDLFSRVHAPLIATLRELSNLEVEERGLSDLAVGGRKILGSSLYLSSRPRLFFYQASLMVDNDLALLDRYLAHPPKEPDYRHGRPHGAFCTTLAELGVSLSADAVGQLVAAGIRRGISPEPE